MSANDICRVSDYDVEECIRRRACSYHASMNMSGEVRLPTDTRCTDCGTILEAGGEAWQTPGPESAILCVTCREERSE